jgi:hypothetical protein
MRSGWRKGGRIWPLPARRMIGGGRGIRTLDRALGPYNGLANRRLQPLGHPSLERNQGLSKNGPGTKTPVVHGFVHEPPQHAQKIAPLQAFAIPRRGALRRRNNKLPECSVGPRPPGALPERQTHENVSGPLRAGEGTRRRADRGVVMSTKVAVSTRRRRTQPGARAAGRSAAAPALTIARPSGLRRWRWGLRPSRRRQRPPSWTRSKGLAAARC